MVCGKGPSIGKKLKEEVVDPLQDVWKEDIRPMTSEVLTAVGTAIGGPVGGAIGGGLGTIIEGGNREEILRGAVSGGVSGFLGSLSPGGSTSKFSDFLPNLKDLAGNVSSGAGNIFSSVGEFISNPIETIKQKVPSLSELGNTAVEKIKSEVARLPENAAKGVLDLINSGSAEQARSLAEGLNSGNSLIDVLTTVWSGQQTKNAAKEAADLQQRGIQAAIDEQRAAREQLRTDLSPYNQLGLSSIDQLQRGLSGQGFNSRAEQLMGGGTNPLLSQAVQERQSYDPSTILSPALLDNPLLQALQTDVTNRLAARNAAQGKLNSGGFARSLQDALVPQAINFGLTLNDLNQQGIAGRESLGLSLEDMRQRELDNLFRSVGIGQNSAAQTGASGLNAASNIGNLQVQGGEAGALGALGRSYGRQQQIGGLNTLFG